MYNPVQKSNLNTLCDAVDIVERRDKEESAAIEMKTPDEVRSVAFGMMMLGEEFLKERNAQESCAVRTCKTNVGLLTNTDDDKSKVKLPNLIADNVENKSDELNKKFIYKCRYSPKECSKVFKSYGSEKKAIHLMRQHVMEHHPLEDSCANVRKRRRVISRKDKMPSGERSKYLLTSSKEFCSVKPMETSAVFMLQEKAAQKKRLDAQLEADDGKDFNGNQDTLKFVQLEHDYATSYNKCPRRCDNSSTANHATKQKKDQQGKVNAAHNAFILSELKRCLDGESYVPPPHVPSAPLPYVYVPQPLEPAQIVEFYSNCEPVAVVRPASVHRNNETSEHHANKRKAESAQMVSASRPVLECLENRVPCKPTASTEQRDGITPDNSIENAENVKESHREIAERNIKILEQQKRKRKCRKKPSVNICEICKQSFTANTSLTCHYRAHLNIKPYKCHICTKSFTRLHSLKYHLMIHNDQTRFWCAICKRGFRHPTHYRDHMKTHEGDQSFSCKLCSDNFKTRISLRKHAKQQHPKQKLVSIGEDSEK